MAETVEVHRQGGAVRIVLNRPDALNAWNGPLGLELRDAVLAAAADDGVRAVLLTGAGRAFSSGADLRDVTSREERTASGHPDLHKVLTERYHPIITAVREMPSRSWPRSTARRPASGSRSPSPRTSSWPASRPTSCWPS